jgi:hypothetical protein
MRKIRSDSRLSKIPENQREMLKVWFFEENLSDAEVSKRCWQDFAVRVSPTAVRGYRQHLEQERILEKIVRDAQAANEIGEAFEKNPAPVPRVVANLVTQLAFEELRKGANLDPDFVVTLTKLAIDSGLKAKKLELDERKVALLEQKAKQAEEAEKALGDSDLTPEQKQQRLRQIFGMS